MQRISYVRRFRSYIPVPCVVALVLTLTVGYASASDPKPPKYDSQTETKMKGTVEDITLPANGHEKEIVHVVMKNGADNIDVYLCPKSFLDDMAFTLSKGDEITVTGSKIKQDGADLVLAKQADRGNDTLVMRDDKGTPVWAWSSKK